MTDTIEGAGRERRDFVRKSLYVAPAILTLQAYSAVAKAGSVKPDSLRDRASARPGRFDQKNTKFDQRQQRQQEKRAQKREQFEARFGEKSNGKGPKDFR